MGDGYGRAKRDLERGRTAAGLRTRVPKYKRGDRIVRDGQVLEFIEEELEGQKWKIIGPAQASQK